MASKEYTIVDGVIFNGARDTEGGIWVRLQDDDDHRILSAAVTKQIKNTEAAKGTLSALDPNAPHLLDDILATLNRVLGSVNGARPASAQLTGTPIGDALAGGGDGAKGGGKKRGKKAAANASADETVVGAIEWASDVPSPRPVVGTAFWSAIGFANEVPQTASAVIGYDAENGHFVVDSANGRAAIAFNTEWDEWIGAGQQPASPTITPPDQAAAALKELIAALRAGPTRLEDSQFESAASVARTLLEIVATPNERLGELRTVTEYLDEYRMSAENAAELAGGIEYDLSQAVALVTTEEATGNVDRGLDKLADKMLDEHKDSTRRNPARVGKPAAKKAAAAKKSAGKGSGGAAKGGAKRKR